MANFTPSQRILDNYADVLINFALNDGEGIRVGETVFLQVPECAKPLLISLRRAVLKAGAHPLIQYLPDNINREYFELANEDQLKFFPAHYLRGRLKQLDHQVMVIAETDKKELAGIDPVKIMTRGKAWKKYLDWRDDKQYQGKFTWTVGLFGTQAMASESGLSLREYWEQIIRACFLNYKYPVKKWHEIQTEMDRLKKTLNALKIRELHLTAKDTDLTISLGKKRKWVGGGGRNIPSFELFTSPDWRGTEGKIRFNQPLYSYGNLIEDVSLEFKAGRVVKAKAKKGENVLLEMLKVPNADKIGEFSLTDGRFSRITHFMAETLFDENRGGKNGNTHLALGKAYKDCYAGDPASLNKKDWQNLGFNHSVVHTDIVATSDRVVTATLAGGDKKVIYKEGKFTL